MKTLRFEKREIDKVLEALKSGKVVAFPTDTVYGLGVIYDQEALKRLKDAKGRSETKPIPTMVSSYAQLMQIAEINKQAKQLIKAFMPGALTLVMKKKDCVPDFVTNGKATIAVRMPDDPFVLSLIEGCGGPLLVSSANRSEMPSALNDREVFSQLDGRIDAVVIGTAGGEKASTIIDVSEAEIKILRIGDISAAQIREALEK